MMIWTGRRRFLKSAQPPKVLARSARRSGGPISREVRGWSTARWTRADARRGATRRFSIRRDRRGRTARMGRRDARRARARRNALDGKGQKKTGSLGAGRGGDRGFFGPVVSLGFPAVGRRAHLRVSRQQGESPILELFASPIRGGHRLAFASTPRSRPPEVSRGTVECTHARKKNKERCLLQADACSRGAPTECLSRDASTIFLATPGARRSAALGRRVRATSMAATSLRFPKALHAGAF